MGVESERVTRVHWFGHLLSAGDLSSSQSRKESQFCDLLWCIRERHHTQTHIHIRVESWQDRAVYFPLWCLLGLSHPQTWVFGSRVLALSCLSCGTRLNILYLPLPQSTFVFVCFFPKALWNPQFGEVERAQTLIADKSCLECRVPPFQGRRFLLFDPQVSSLYNSLTLSACLVDRVRWTQTKCLARGGHSMLVSELGGTAPWSTGVTSYSLPSVSWGFPGGSDSKESACSAGDSGLISGLRRSLDCGVLSWFSVGGHEKPLENKTKIPTKMKSC